VNPTGAADHVECGSESVLVRIEPAGGAKVTSLLHLPTQREWLTSRPDGAAADDGPIYGAAVAYGWDECFPNIGAGAYPGEERRAGTPLPDHGELWSRPWSVVDAGPGHVELEVGGSCLPYEFVRRLEVDGEHVLVSYRVTNTGDDGFHALWAMHPLLALDSGARIVLPGVDGAAVVESASAAALARDGRVAWPTTTATDGSRVDLSTYGGRPGIALKLVVERPTRRAAIADPGTRAWLGFETTLRSVPHLGVWLNEGGWPEGPVRLRHVALEPTSGLADDLGEAVAAGSGWWIEPGASRQWQVALRLGSGEKALREWLGSG
jgi:galactose mutarotase-like enzyme